MAKIKICGLFREEDIGFANEAGPDFGGFVFAESRRQVSAKQAARLRPRLRAGIVPVGVFVNARAEEIAALYRDGIIAIAQLHGGEDAAYIRRLKTLSAASGFPPVPVIKTLRAGGPNPAVLRHSRRHTGADMGPTGAVKRNRKGREGAAKDAKRDDYFADAAGAAGDAADYLLFDSGAGSGKPFDWTLFDSALHPSVSSLSTPWFLAGGISLENIGRALSLRSFGIDVSSGAETDGIKDRKKMIALVKRVREENL